MSETVVTLEGERKIGKLKSSILDASQEDLHKVISTGGEYEDKVELEVVETRSSY